MNTTNDLPVKHEIPISSLTHSNNKTYVEKGRIWLEKNRRDGVAVRASTSYSVDLTLIPLSSHNKNFKNGIHRFPA